MDLIAQRKDDASHRSLIRENGNGIEAVEWYLVNTDDCRKVLTAPGLPQVDDPFDAIAYPDVLCYGRAVETKIGGEDVSTGRVGWSWVRVDYATPGSGVFNTPNLYPGQKWTEIELSERSENIQVSPFDTAKPSINNGDGLNIERGMVILVVHRCWELDHQPDFARYNTLTRDRLFNDAPITVPKVFGSGAQWTVPAEQAQYKGYETQVQGKVLIVKHFLQLGLEPLYGWFPLNPLTLAYENYKVYAKVYDKASFAGLW